MTLRTYALIAFGLVLAACSQTERPLEGERLSLRGLPETETTSGNVPFAPPPVTRNRDWTHRAGSAANTPVHPALSAAPALAWSEDIGQGDGARHRITADPVVASGRVFTLDSRASVAAVSTTGDSLWSTDLTPASDREDEGSGGGLASDGARVYATTGFGRVVALDAATGAILWEQRLNAAATAPPTVANGVVYVVSNDSRAWAIDAGDGRIIWDVAGTPSGSGILGGAGPAVTDRLVLLPFSSAEVVGVLKGSGLRVWAAPISGQRRGRVYSRFSDITGDPVVAGSSVYIGNPAGRTVAVDLASGARLWTAEDGAVGPVQVAGGSVFLISDQNKLIRLDADTGARIWATPLPYFTASRPRRLRDITDHYGPVLAGGRLYVASGDDVLRVYSPSTGQLTGEIALPGGAASQPAVAGDTMYIVSSRGDLLAYR